MNTQINLDSINTVFSGGLSSTVPNGFPSYELLPGNTKKLHIFFETVRFALNFNIYT
jgi:hypothetical protein